METSTIDPRTIAALGEIYPELDVQKLFALKDADLAVAQQEGVQAVRGLLEELGLANIRISWVVSLFIRESEDFLMEIALQDLLNFRHQAERLIIEAYRSIDNLSACSSETLSQIKSLSLLVDPQELMEGRRGQELVQALSHCKALESLNICFEGTDDEVITPISLPGLGVVLAQISHLTSLYVDVFYSSNPFQRVVLNGADLEGFDRAPIENLQISWQGTNPSIAPDSTLAENLKHLGLKLDALAAEGLNMSHLKNLRSAKIHLGAESWEKRPPLPLDRFCQMPNLEALEIVGGDLTQLMPHLARLFPSLKDIAANKFSNEPNIGFNAFPDCIETIAFFIPSFHEVWRSWEGVTEDELKAVNGVIGSNFVLIKRIESKSTLPSPEGGIEGVFEFISTG